MDGELNRGRALRVLLSAYACEPHKGSEPGIGWSWATALARAGHDVWVVTRSNNRPAIQQALAAQPLAGLRFAYYDLPRWARWWKRGPRGVRLYYTLWQWGAYRLARRLCRSVRFDVAHHITFGVFRHPSFMAFLGLPFVFGPVGGGETAPFGLRRTYPLRAFVADLARDLANGYARVDPLMHAVYRRSAAVLCKTAETLRCIPRRYHGRCLVSIELGAEAQGRPPEARAPRGDGAFRVLYVGRLVHWKGLHLGLAAFAKLRAVCPGARLTVIGSGPAEPRMRSLARRAGIAEAITWVPWIERAAVMRAYVEHDAFLFPSLHDSSGNAVLEALSCGLPVICLDTGGPAVLVDGSCGFRVPAGRPERTVAGLAQALCALAADAELARRMAGGALRRAHGHFSWEQQAARMERLYRTVIAAAAVAGPAAEPAR
ncbi:MAG: glycosyltransferase family 4 protein [Betaproteobacteria bacterium]|nr:glycosyltransferase family 4 protein [Betaproteobacteria bacterium]